MKKNKIDWFLKARFGMFIHWGLYSLPGRGEWVMYHERIPPEVYAPLADRFNPSRFDPDAWAALAKSTGMEYMVLTTRHHDGFCLFDSKDSDFTSVKTAARRDFVAEYVKACRRAGLKVGLYYSLGDWRFGFPKINDSVDGAARMLRQAHAQVRELMTQYGKIDILWYDGGWCYPSLPDDGQREVARFWKARKLNAMVRELQPHILINNRSGLPEDFGTPEQHIRAEKPGRGWECCMTIGDERGWGYLRYDPTPKTATVLIQTLATCASQGGNFLLNVSPKADGVIPAVQRKTLEKIGLWMKVNAQSIHGTSRAPFGGGSAGMCSAKGKKVYLHVFRWPGRELVLPEVKGNIISAKIVATRKSAIIDKTPDGRVLLRNLPPKPVDKSDTVIEITVA